MDRVAHEIADEASPYTMIERARLLDNIEFMRALAGSGEFPAGSIVECGTWRGGMALATSRVFGEQRKYALYDSFEGLPEPSSRDGTDARWWASHPEHPRNFDNCRADYDEIRKIFARLRPGHSIKIVKGWFEQTLNAEDIGPIAWAHLDCDWYDSTYLCLDRLWSSVSPGGVIAIDDYYDWEGCRCAVHDFLSRHQAREAIERIGNHGGIAIRRLGAWNLAESPHLH